MRINTVMVVAVALCAPALAQGFGGSNERSTTTTQTTTTKNQSGDTTTTTTTTRTETSSQGGGFSFGDAFGGHHRKSDKSTYESLGGKWTIGEENGSKTCELTLEKSKFISSYGARTGIGCPEGLFQVSSWLLAGDEIRLLSPSGQLLAKLYDEGRGRWEGRTTGGLEIFMTRQ